MEWIQAVRKASQAAEGRGKEVLARFYREHPELAPGDEDSGPKNQFFAESHAIQLEVARQTRPLTDRFDRQFEAQRRLEGWTRIFSPSIIMQEGVDDISGTGITRHRDFRGQAERFHHEWLAYFVPKMFRNELMRPEDHRAYPRFRFREEPDRDLERRGLLALAELLVLAGLVGGLSSHALRTFPIIES